MLAQVGTGRLLLTLAMFGAAVLLARFAWDVPMALTAERALYDVRATLMAPQVDQDDRIVLVVFTEDTLAATGKRSPLDRALLAAALNHIDALAPRSIGVDILLDQAQPEDAVLVPVLAAMRTPTFLAYASASDNAEFIKPWQETHLRALLARLGAAPVRPATIRLDVDSDGTMRSWPNPVTARRPPLLVDAVTGSDAMRGYRGAALQRLPRTRERPVFSVLPIDLFGDAGAAAALSGQIKGRIVLVGADLADADRFSTPATRVTGNSVPGVELHAALIAQALDSRQPQVVSRGVLWLLALAAVAGGALTGGLDLRARFVVPLALLQVMAIIALPFGLQHHGDFDTLGYPAVGHAGGWLLALLAASTTARLVGAEQRHFAQSALGRYLPRDVAQTILRDPGKLALHGERRDIVALFTDIEGFTSLCQSLPPETVATLLNEYLETMSAIILAHGGTIDKFVGDAVVAFWGAPIARPDDGDRAVAAAIALGAAGARLARPVPDRVSIGRTRVGLHRGEAVVGNFGGEGRIQYTALGDSMNVAARLEGANKQLKTGVLVSSEAATGVSSARFRPMGRVRVRGRARPIDLYEPLPGGVDADVAAAALELGVLYRRFDGGDAGALAALRAMSAASPGDVALAGFVGRLEAVGPGGCYDLD